MTWIHPLSAKVEAPPSVLGGKACGLIELLRLGLPVPPGFVITTEACRAFLRDGRLPGLATELAAALAELEDATGRRFGGPAHPLVVSVRSGASVSVPGMMSTILNLGLTTTTTPRLADETDERFAADSHRRLVDSFSAVVGHRPPDDSQSQLDLAVTAVLAEREPAVWAALKNALKRIEEHYRDARNVEFTYETGKLWLLQARPATKAPLSPSTAPLAM